MLTIKPAREALTKRIQSATRIDIYKDSVYIHSIHNAQALTSERMLNLLSNGYAIKPIYNN